MKTFSAEFRRFPTLFLLMVLIFSAGAGEAAAKVRPAPGAYKRQHIQAMVRTEAVRLGVPISLALAVAHAESYFEPAALSHAGARGVMQVMPATARDEYGIPAHMLWQPRINIRLGLHFLKRLLKRYKGRVDLALSYYNGGSAVGDLPRARVIPTTRRYVRRVRSLQRQYRRKLYFGGI